MNPTTKYKDELKISIALVVTRSMNAKNNNKMKISQ